MSGRILRPMAEKQRLVLPRVGLIKVGMKSEAGYPQSVDYFIASGKYASLFNKAYGEKPQSIQIVFPDDDPSNVCREQYEYRDDEGKLISSGDGEAFEVWDGSKYRSMSTMDYPNLMESIAKKYPNRKVKKGEDGWSVTLTLTFIIPCVQGIAGVWQFISKGTASSIPQIRDTFDSMLDSRGYCKGILFDLNVKFAISNKPGDKSRYPVVSLVPNQSEENMTKVKQALSSGGIIDESKMLGGGKC